MTQLLYNVYTYKPQFHHSVFLLPLQTCHNRLEWVEGSQTIRLFLVSDTQRMRCRSLQNGNPILNSYAYNKEY
jgi:hypothetical protein